MRHSLPTDVSDGVLSVAVVSGVAVVRALTIVIPVESGLLAEAVRQVPCGIVHSAVVDHRVVSAREIASQNDMPPHLRCVTVSDLVIVRSLEGLLIVPEKRHRQSSVFPHLLRSMDEVECAFPFSCAFV